MKPEEFNEMWEPGIEVIYYPAKKEDGTNDPEGSFVTDTLGYAFYALSGEPVVFVDGVSGYVSLDHVEVLGY
ncbi:MAG: hypothetical protein GY800_08905 [Planctomycetes bacterium]|nr:hypothetical protein [Planctomycetota bacterium]